MGRFRPFTRLPAASPRLPLCLLFGLMGCPGWLHSFGLRVQSGCVVALATQYWPSPQSRHAALADNHKTPLGKAENQGAAKATRNLSAARTRWHSRSRVVPIGQDAHLLRVQESSPITRPTLYRSNRLSRLDGSDCPPILYLITPSINTSLSNDFLRGCIEI
jgi:hypothetical protein